MTGFFRATSVPNVIWSGSISCSSRFPSSTAVSTSSGISWSSSTWLISSSCFSSAITSTGNIGSIMMSSSIIFSNLDAFVISANPWMLLSQVNTLSWRTYLSTHERSDSILSTTPNVYLFFAWTGSVPCLTLSKMRQTSPTSIWGLIRLNLPNDAKFLVIKISKVSLKTSILSWIIVALLVSGELCMLKILSGSPKHDVCLRSRSAHVRYAGQRMFFSSTVDSAVNNKGRWLRMSQAVARVLVTSIGVNLVWLSS